MCYPLLPYRRRSRLGYGLAFKLSVASQYLLLLWVDVVKTLHLSVCACYWHELLDALRHGKAKFGRD